MRRSLRQCLPLDAEGLKREEGTQRVTPLAADR